MSTSRRRVDVFEHHRATNSHNKQHTEQLLSLNNAHTQDGVGGGSKLGVMTDSIASSNNTISSQSVLTASRLNNIQNAITQDGVGGGNKLGVMTDAINTNIISSLSKLDTIATNTANIHIDVESVNLNVDTLEAKTEAISNAQTQDGVGGGNKPGVMLDAINTNTITGNSKLDTIIANTASSSSTGLATETNLTSLKNSLTGDGAGGDNAPGVMLKAINDNIINTNTVALSGVDGTLQGIDTLLGDTQTIHTATNTKLDTLEATLTAIETDQAALEVLHTATNSKIDTIDSVLDNAEAHLGNIDTGIDVLEACVGSNKVNVNISSGNISGFATESTLSAAETHLGNIETAVQLLDNIVSGSEAQVDIVSSALPSGAATQATLADAEAHLGNIDTGIDVLEACVGSNKVNVNISSGNISGFATESTLSAAEAHLGNIETAVQLLDNIVSGSEAQVDIVSSALPSGAATQATLADAETHLGNIETSVQLLDDVVKAEDTAHSGADKGIMGLSVRKNTAVALAGSDADYQPLITDANGKLYTIPSKKFSAITTLFSGVSVGSSATSSASSAVEVPYETGIPSQGLGGGHRITFSSQSSTNSSYSIALTESMDDSTYFTTDTNLNDVGGGAQQNFMGSFQTSARYFKLTITNTHSGSQDFTIKVIGGELS